jgi:hypothetical protein
VLEPRRRKGFELEAIDEARILGEGLMKHLHRDGLVEGNLPRTVDRPHRARAHHGFKRVLVGERPAYERD